MCSLIDRALILAIPLGETQVANSQKTTACNLCRLPATLLVELVTWQLPLCAGNDCSCHTPSVWLENKNTKLLSLHAQAMTGETAAGHTAPSRCYSDEDRSTGSRAFNRYLDLIVY